MRRALAIIAIITVALLTVATPASAKKPDKPGNGNGNGGDPALENPSAFAEFFGDFGEPDLCVVGVRWDVIGVKGKNTYLRYTLTWDQVNGDVYDGADVDSTVLLGNSKNFPTIAAGGLFEPAQDVAGEAFDVTLTGELLSINKKGDVEVLSGPYEFGFDPQDDNRVTCPTPPA